MERPAPKLFPGFHPRENEQHDADCEQREDESRIHENLEVLIHGLTPHGSISLFDIGQGIQIMRFVDEFQMRVRAARSSCCST